jgi:hypothetical protein
MGIENTKNPEYFEKTVVVNPTVEQPAIQISPEKIKQAKKVVLGSLEIDPTETLDDFDEKLKKATRLLPKYKQIEQKLEGIERQNLPHELFKVLKKASDDIQYDPNAPKDGVLIKSMKQGKLECAGITLIASTFLQEHEVDHVAVSGPGHAFLIVEQPPDTLVYFDANNNLFFTFPKSALAGYKGADISAECRLKEYTPRGTDFADGVTTAFAHFVTMPAKEGIGRQYLGNVAAALNGNTEFDTTGIAFDQKSADATRQLETEIYGKNKVLENFYDKVEGLIELEEIQTKDDKETIDTILKTHPNHDDFVTFFTVFLGGIGNRIPYIKNASVEQKRAYVEKVWDFLNKHRDTDKTISIGR